MCREFPLAIRTSYGHSVSDVTYAVRFAILLRLTSPLHPLTFSSPSPRKQCLVKALRQHRYGAPTEVLTLTEVEQPDLGPRDVLVRVEAVSLNPLDWHIVRGEPLIARISLGMRRPKDKVPGADFAGTVAEIGPKVQDFSIGDPVFGTTYVVGHGAYAAYVRVPAGRIAMRPAPLSAKDAAALPVAGSTALQTLRHGNTGPGHRVLVIGASGGVGTFAVQLAVSLGAEVTGVSSGRNIDLVKSLGAQQAVNYEEQSLSELAPDSFDTILLLAGVHDPTKLKPLLRKTGALLMLGGDGGRIVGPLMLAVKGMLASRRKGRRIEMLTVAPNRADLEILAEAVAQG